jgi:RNA polymerase sigma-70 factor (ECF subfamily)
MGSCERSRASRITRDQIGAAGRVGATNVRRQGRAVSLVRERPRSRAAAAAAAEADGGSMASALVERARVGDRLAFEALIGIRLERLLRLALSIVGNEADARDAVQESCLRAWRELPRLRDPDRFEAWLWRITINACRSSLRGRRRTSVHEIAVDDSSPGPEPAQPGNAFADDVTVKDAIRRAFRRLDPDKRSILVLHYVEERPVTDIARLLGIAEGTAKSRLHAARKALERALEVER